jgi:hypothetical protein
MNEVRRVTMKVRRILVLVAAAAFAQLGYAKAVGEHAAPRPRALPPVRVQGPNYAQLGAQQAVLDFCSRVDSGEEKQYVAEGKTLFAGIREDGLEKARGSSQYKNAYSTMETTVGRIPPAEALKGCKDLIAAASPAKGSGKTPPSNPSGKTPGHTSGGNAPGHTAGGNTPGHTPGHGPSKGVGERAKGAVGE